VKAAGDHIDHTSAYINCQEPGRAGFRLLEIGTGNSGFGQIALYERCGFVRCGIDVDYFRKHSPTPIFENGVECRHMVRLHMELV